MLEFENVSKSFWTGTQRKVILDRVSFRIEPGNSLGVLERGACFGETSYVRGAKRTASIKADGPATILRVSSTLMEQVSSACQLRFNKVFLRSLITRLQGNGSDSTT